MLSRSFVHNSVIEALKELYAAFGLFIYGVSNNAAVFTLRFDNGSEYSDNFY